MSRILVIGPNYFNFLNAVSESFRKLGHEVHTDGYDNPVHPYNAFNRFRWKIASNRVKMLENSRRLYAEHICGVFSDVRPDFVFIMNGDIFESGTLELFRKTSKVVLWLFDIRDKVRGSRENGRHVDSLFCFDKNDVDAFVREGVDARFLPQAYDEDIYRPLNLEKDIDILFVGNMMYSPKRRETVLKVINAFPDRKIQVHGLWSPWYKGPVRWLCRPFKDIITNGNVTPQQANALYNRARVVLNIHQEHQKDGANPRVFEICGAGAYQICDANPYLRNIFANGGIGLYDTATGLETLIGEALKPSFERPPLPEGILEANTFTARMREVMKIFN